MFSVLETNSPGCETVCLTVLLTNPTPGRGTLYVQGRDPTGKTEVTGRVSGLTGGRRTSSYVVRECRTGPSRPTSSGAPPTWPTARSILGTSVSPTLSSPVIVHLLSDKGSTRGGVYGGRLDGGHCHWKRKTPSMDDDGSRTRPTPGSLSLYCRTEVSEFWRTHGRSLHTHTRPPPPTPRPSATRTV